MLVDDYSGITALLQRLAASYKRASIFISGAAADYGSWKRNDAEQFLHRLGHQIASEKNRIVTGFGEGVGGAYLTAPWHI